MTRFASSWSCTASPDRGRLVDRIARLSFALCLAVALGCDVGASVDPRPWDIRLLAQADGSVSRWGPVRFQLDRPVSSYSVDRGSVRLSSGAVVEFVSLWFDPLTDQLVLDLSRPLLVDASYVARLAGLADLDGAWLDPPQQLLVRPVDSDRPVPAEAVSFDSVLPILMLRCAGSGCHDAGARAADLVLSDAAGIRDTALGHTSRQVDSPNAAADPDAAGLIELPIIDSAGVSTSVSRSYLIYKVLGDPHVLGERMPPESAGPALSADDTQLLARWIMAGAPLE